jgi:hypothetical protein
MYYGSGKWALWSASMACFSISMVAMAHLQLALDVRNGQGTLSWTNAQTNVWCAVEWACSMNGPWHHSWQTLCNVHVTNDAHTAVGVPMFYRVVQTTNNVRPYVRQYEGANLTNWEVVVGDGIYHQPDEAPVNQSDVETLHFSTHSEVRANLTQRGIMAHNITFKRFVDEKAFDYIHTCSYSFRLPYLPATANVGTNAQTMEVAFFIWDGAGTRLDYGMAIQWILNPWVSDFGAIRCWSDAHGGEWNPVGYLAPDTQWHDVELTFDYRRQTTSLKLDGTHVPCRFTAIPKDSSWGSEIAARFCAEIVSLHPGESNPGALHRVEFKNWRWTWEPYD